MHCADSETNGAARIRYVVCEPEPLVLGYDENVWAVALDYHGHPVDVALATVRAVRANTLVVLRRLPEEAWATNQVIRVVDAKIGTKTIWERSIASLRAPLASEPK